MEGVKESSVPPVNDENGVQNNGSAIVEFRRVLSEAGVPDYLICALEANCPSEDVVWSCYRYASANLRFTNQLMDSVNAIKKRAEEATQRLAVLEVEAKRNEENDRTIVDLKEKLGGVEKALEEAKSTLQQQAEKIDELEHVDEVEGLKTVLKEKTGKYEKLKEEFWNLKRAFCKTDENLKSKEASLEELGKEKTALMEALRMLTDANRSLHDQLAELRRSPDLQDFEMNHRD